ncbi:hypothetical protein F5I97DRAFT_1340732 [Phlebopus sp. FC_14]|nr:hypothetical protein F5I97DRAFT_1340732 [Phlebopus sp. FC_14]
MSDALPTPPIPQSPISNDAFEALIDLLASDGIDNIHSPRAGHQASVELRDSSGRLDFDRIRSMFATQNQDQVAKPTHSSSPGPRNEDEKASDTVSHLSSSTHASSSRSASSPKHGHTSASDVVESGPSLQPSILRVPFSFEEVDTALSHAHAEVASLRQKYDELQILVSKRFGRTGRHSSSNTPTGTKDMNDANNDDVHPAPPPVQPPIPIASPLVIPQSEPGYEHSSPERDHALRPGLQLSPHSDLPPDIDYLSENEAKHALTTILRALNIAPGSVIKCETISPYVHEKKASERTLEEIVSAVKFLTAVDELVWRRSLTEGPTGTISDGSARVLAPTFSTDNTSTLLSRLQLWERAVRGTTRS